MAFLSVEDVYGGIESLVFPKTFDKIGKYLIEDEIVLLSGKVSLRDDEVPKILCEDVVPLDEIPDDAALLKDYRPPARVYDSGSSALESYDLEPPEYAAPVPAIPKEAEAEIPSEPVKTERDSRVSAPAHTAARGTAGKAPKGIFLRVSGMSADDCVKAKKMCAIFPGPMSVILYYNDSKGYDMNCGISVERNDALLNGLRRLLGDANVVVRN